jgi:hypothetical protein
MGLEDEQKMLTTFGNPRQEEEKAELEYLLAMVTE